MARIEKDRLCWLLKVFILASMIGIIGACSPLRDSDLATIKTHKKYPLKIAVITTYIKDYKFTPDREKGGYYIGIYTSNKQKYYHSYYGRLEPACKEFFPLLFYKVDFFDDYIPGNENYDLIAKLLPLGVSDFSKDTRKSVELRLSMRVDFVDRNNRHIFDTTIHSTGTHELSEAGDRRIRIERNVPKDAGRKDKNYLSAMSNAVRGVFKQLGEDLTQHPNPLDKYVVYLAAIKQRELEKKTMPASLIATVHYSDKASLLPNNTLNAGEDSGILVSVTNKGKGTAFDVTLTTESKYKHIDFPKTISLGDIQPGKSKDVEIKVKGGLDLADGTVPFRIVCKEKRGYDSRQYVLNIPAASLERPIITIASYKINDGNTGLARGNGNGIPENGETIELIPFVRNNGVGRALKVKLSIASINQGIEVNRRSATIPQILPGQTVTANLAFSIPRTYSGGTIEIDFTASDVRGASEARKVFAINMESHWPVLAYTYRIIDRNGNDVLENGEEGEIEIVPANKGKMEARNLRVSLQSDGLVFSKKHSKIEYIPAGSKYSPLRFAFKVPRTFQNDSVDVRVQFDQQDFPGLTDRISIPVRLALPDFEIAHQILDRNNNGVIEQGETVDLIVKVRNTGRLDADNMVLNISAGPNGDIKEGVRLISDKTVRIGRLAAGSESEPQTFTIHVQHRASEGNLPLHFTIKQKDFSDKDLSLALNIVPEQAEVITVAGQRPEQVYSTPTTIYNAPPVIAIASPRNNNKVASEFVMFSGNIADDRGVADIDIFVNGCRLETSRGIGVVGKDSGDQRELGFNHKIPLRMGKNEITITAFDIENLSSSKTITVHRETEIGEMWAAVIGINRYQQSPKVPALNYAENDARAFADYLRKNMKIDRDHLFELYDSEATVRNMKSVLGTRLRRMADRPEDTVYIFFAGHGAPEKDPESKDGDGIAKYILAYDSDPQDLYSTAMPMDEVARILSRIRAERIIFIADSCYSGGAGGRTILAPGRRANLSDAFLERIAQSGKGRIILSSSNANEVSQESDELRHGYFTYYLLKGLKGEADLDGDRLIDIDEIYRYLNKWVPDQTKGTQHPVKKGQAEGLVIVGRTN